MTASSVSWAECLNILRRDTLFLVVFSTMCAIQFNAFPLFSPFARKKTAGETLGEPHGDVSCAKS
jgi:hypothetical protein